MMERAQGNYKTGALHPGAKLNADKVRLIRALHSLDFSQRALSVLFKVSAATISQVVHRDTWRHV